jgi:hypothetical protein
VESWGSDPRCSVVHALTPLRYLGWRRHVRAHYHGGTAAVQAGADKTTARKKQAWRKCAGAHAHALHCTHAETTRAELHTVHI